MFARRKKSLLLVDFDNVERVGAAFVRKIENWVAWIEDGGFDTQLTKRTLLGKRVYWNSHHDRHRVPFERAGFDVVVCQAWRSAKGSSVDFELTIDAIDYAHTLKRTLDEVIILAFDTDYLSVVHRLQDKEVEAVVMVTDQPISDVYRDRANHVISEAQMRAACEYERKASGVFVKRAAPAKAEAPGAPRPAPAVTPASPAKPAAPAPAASKKREASPPHDKPFGIDDAVKRIERAAAQTPGKPLSKRVVCDLLREVSGFYTEPPRHFFGRNAYYGMIEFLVTKSKQLRIVRLSGGGKAIASKPAAPEKQPTT